MRLISIGSLNLLWVFDKVNETFFSSLIDAWSLSAENRENCTKSASILQTFQGREEPQTP